MGRALFLFAFLSFLGHRLALAVGSTVRICDTANGTELMRLSDIYWVACVRCSPDGRYILSGGFDSSAVLWDSLSGEAIVAYEGHKHYVCFAVFWTLCSDRVPMV